MVSWSLSLDLLSSSLLPPGTCRPLCRLTLFFQEPVARWSVYKLRAATVSGV